MLRRLARFHRPSLADRVGERLAWQARLGDALLDYAMPAEIDWAERLVRSRGIACTDAESGRRGLHLLPLLDLANHREPSPSVRKRAEAADEGEDDMHASPLIETEDGVTVLCAPTALAAGDEITFRYTDEGNDRLLMDYGFAALTTPEDKEHLLDYVSLEELDVLLANNPEETLKRLWPAAVTHPDASNE